MGVADDFQRFRDEYNIGQLLISSIGARYRRITTRLNKDFRNLDSDVAYSLYVGSYGRDTAARGVSDLDVAYILPPALYKQYNDYAGNGQSALLQRVKVSIQNTYPLSDISGDGQVVVSNFTDGVKFEVLPVFENTANTFTYANANGGGTWKACNPRAEIKAVHERNILVNHNLKNLCRMMRVWRDYNSVPMSGALIDALAYKFLETWEYKDKSFYYHDFMVRDFLKFLYEQDREQTYWRMPGSGSEVAKTGVFRLKALACHTLSIDACLLQKEEEGPKRRAKWRTIFGPTFPI